MLFRNVLPVIGYRRDGRPIHLIAGGSDDTVPTPFALPDDLTSVPDTDLAALREQATAEFDAVYTAEGGPSVADLARATALATAVDTIDAQLSARAAARTSFDQLQQRVHPPQPDPAPEPEPAPAPPGGPAPTDSVTPPAAAPEPAPVVASGGALTAPRDSGGLNPQRGQLNASLRAAQDLAPDPQVPSGGAGQELVITAAAGTSGAPIGHRFNDVATLGRFITQHARSLPVTDGAPQYTPFATVQRQYEHVLNESTDPARVAELLERITQPEVLVAAGGWCAPSEIRYQFFNVACQARTGLIDLPTIGIDRGGIRWPTSPSLADVFVSPAAFAPFGATFSVTSMPWLWTEASDIAAVTGGATKPCIRIPCPAFNEARLECFGYCVTAGNLADNAYPEATANFLSLLMAAEIRVENFRYLAQMVSLSTLATAASGIGAAGSGVTAPVLGAIELAAIDYRGKYGMCDTDVLELVLPTWVKGAVRSDLAKRTGVSDLFNVTDAMIANWMDARGVRVQFVGEYQQRTAGYPGGVTPVTAWPTAVEFMLYAAGTFVRGDGMSLDLGVVRDSTLNATNDHTAAWAETCHLIARFGHESRRYIVNICTDGTTGAADLTACGL
jgi:hypothetical protein